MITFNIEKTRAPRTLHFKGCIPDGAITVLMGPSGVGKSTLARLIMGLDVPERGSIAINRRVVFDHDRAINVPAEARGLGVLFQTPRLLPQLTVRENILLPVQAGARTPPIRLEVAVTALGIEHLTERFPNTLSGGEAQRVALARAFMAAEEALLLDEPLASLERALRVRILEALKALSGAFARPILYITHSPFEAAHLAPTALVMGQQGELTQYQTRQRRPNSYLEDELSAQQELSA
mgnify:CR=1 FL=1